MMTSKEALDLEKKLTVPDEAHIRRVGTIKITDVETGEVTTSATYAAADVIDLLNDGHSIETVISILAKAD